MGHRVGVHEVNGLARHLRTKWSGYEDWRETLSKYLGRRRWYLRAYFDQTKFPHALEIMTLESMTDAAVAIREMKVRGAPSLGQ